MSFLTCFWDLPQKLHFTRSLDSPNFAMCSCSPVLGSGDASGLGQAGQLACRDHFVDDAVVLGLVRAHDEVPIGVLLDLLNRHAGVEGKHLVEEIAHPHDLLGLQLDVGGLPGGTAVRLVDEDAGMGKCETLALGAGGQQDRCGRRRLSVAERGDLVLDVLQGVVDREQGGDVAARAVDVQADVLVGALGFQEQDLGDHDVGDVVVDRRAEEDDVLPEQARVDVPSSLAPVRRLDDLGDVIGHSPLTSVSSAPASGGSSASSGGARSARSMACPSSSTTSTCSTSHSRALAFLTSERTAAIWSVRSSCLRSWFGLALIRCARRSISSSTSSSETSTSSASATARRARSALTACSADSRMLSTSSSPVWPVASMYCGMVAPCDWRRCSRSCRRRSISASTSALGGSSSTSSISASTTAFCSAIWAWNRFIRPSRLAMSAFSSSTVSNSDASPAHSSVTSGRTFSLMSLTNTRNRMSSSVSGPLKSRMSPTLAPSSRASRTGP